METYGITNASTERSSSGVKEAAQCRQALEEIHRTIEHFKEASSMLSDRILQRHTSLKQITSAVSSRDTAAQNNAESSQKLQTDSETLQHSLESMDENLEELLSLVGRKRAA